MLPYRNKLERLPLPLTLSCNNSNQLQILSLVKYSVLLIKQFCNIQLKGLCSPPSFNRPLGFSTQASQLGIFKNVCKYSVLIFTSWGTQHCPGLCIRWEMGKGNGSKLGEPCGRLDQIRLAAVLPVHLRASLHSFATVLTASTQRGLGYSFCQVREEGSQVCEE